MVDTSPIPPRPDLGGALAPPAVGATVTPLAGYGQRIGGYLLDVLVMVPIALVLLSTRWDSVRAVFDYISAHPGQTSIPTSLMSQFQDALRPVALAAAAAWFLYNTAMVAWRGQTIGKIGAHTKVVRSAGDETRGVSVARSAIRAIVPMLGTIIPVLGWLVPIVVYGAMLFTPRRQGLHDLAAGTIVIRPT
jgi:uncharacterized RDD family membrane protein YckC